MWNPSLFQLLIQHLKQFATYVSGIFGSVTDKTKLK